MLVDDPDAQTVYKVGKTIGMNDCGDNIVENDIYTILDNDDGIDDERASEV